MIQISVEGWIDTVKFKDGHTSEVVRREVSLLDDNGALIMKINVPSAERLVLATKDDDATLAEVSAAIQAKLAEFAEEAAKSGAAPTSAGRVRKERKVFARVS
jgi:hypothetical protein